MLTAVPGDRVICRASSHDALWRTGQIETVNKTGAAVVIQLDDGIAFMGANKMTVEQSNIRSFDARNAISSGLHGELITRLITPKLAAVEGGHIHGVRISAGADPCRYTGNKLFFIAVEAGCTDALDALRAYVSPVAKTSSNQTALHIVAGLSDLDAMRCPTYLACTYQLPRLTNVACGCRAGASSGGSRQK